jgi:hypothetical protein
MKMTNIREAKSQHSNLEVAGIASTAQWSSGRTPEANQAEYPQSRSQKAGQRWPIAFFHGSA